MSLLEKIENLTELCHNIKATGTRYRWHIFLVDDAILIAKEKLDSINDVLIERDETAKENKKQTFGTKKEKNWKSFAPFQTWK